MVGIKVAVVAMSNARLHMLNLTCGPANARKLRYVLCICEFNGRVKDGS